MAEKSNANLFRNTDYLLAVSKHTNAYNLSWVAPAKQRYDSSKFKLHNNLFMAIF